MSKLLALILFAALGMLAGHPVGWGLGAAAVGLAWLRPGRVERLVACLALAMLIPIWQLAMAVGLSLFLLLERRRPAGWSRGTVPAAPTILAAAVTPVGLIGWFVLTTPDLSDLAATYLPDVPTAVLVAGGVVFVVVNATLEEAIWRGVFQPELEPELGVNGAVVVQAVSFGLAHVHGFPRGALGVALATGWAVLLGFVRHRGSGLLAPILAHLLADAVIAGIVLTQLT